MEEERYFRIYDITHDAHWACALSECAEDKRDGIVGPLMTFTETQAWIADGLARGLPIRADALEQFGPHLK